MDTFPFSPLNNLFEEGKQLLAVTSFEATNSFFNISNRNNSFSFTTQGGCTLEGGGEFISKLNELYLRSQNVNES